MKTKPTITRKVLKTWIGQRLLLLAGAYTMGDASQDGAPPHRCVIDHSFYIGETPVTQDQYFRLMRTKPWEGVDCAGSGRNVAATCMTYDDACEFASG
jgi:formylglycine-generating enzyme required for sulfatase activity